MDIGLAFYGTVNHDRLDFLLPGCQIKGMQKEGIQIKTLPRLKQPFLIAGFEGWGNAMDVSSRMADYLARTLKAEEFARLNPDNYYRFDEDRPLVNIDQGVLKTISYPSGSFFAARTDAESCDLVILRAKEPSLCWFDFTNQLFSLCARLGVETVITLGSMYDNVLHSDRIISGIASDEATSSRLRQQSVVPISYQGPSAIHSIIQFLGEQKGFRCISLWCHCPFYFRGATHFGLLSCLGRLLASLGSFRLDTQELDEQWDALNTQIEKLIESNPELQALIQQLRSARTAESRASIRQALKKDQKVINLKDFLDPK